MTVDDRSRGQVMADTLVERITGRPADKPVPVALNLVIADTTLAGDDNEPAWLHGYGPIPAGFARKLTGDAALDADAKATLRRLYRHPTSGQLVAMESRSRIFPKGLAAFIGLRDLTCRTPYCNAPIRHHDHATPAREGGPTSARNGLGDCRSLQLRQRSPRLDSDHQRRERQPHRRIQHPHRRHLPLHRTPTTRTTALQQIQHHRRPTQHRPHHPPRRLAECGWDSANWVSRTLLPDGSRNPQSMP